MYKLKQPQEGAPRKKLLQNLDKKKGEEGKFIMRKILKNFCEVNY